MENLIVPVLIATAAIVGGVVSRFLNGKSAKPSPVAESTKEVSAPVQPVQPVQQITNPAATQLLERAETRAKEILLDAKSQALKIRTTAEDEARKLKESTIEFEKKVAVQRAQLDAERKDIEQKAKAIRAVKETIEKKLEEVDEIVTKQKDALEKVASMNKEEAKALLIKQLDKELAEEKGRRIRENEDEIRRESDKKSLQILVDAMRFGATDYIVEYTTSKIKLPDEDIKGRIIGKEGRNIRTFEELSGVDMDLDSSPGDIIISSFDPVRREIARMAMERLLIDGRIQPAKIEELIEKAKSEVDHIMLKEGDNLCHKLGVYSIPKELIQMLGRFKYRFSYGQNMIEHTLEETRIGVAIAHELGADVEVVKLGCLFHDIGKVVNDEEGTHVQLGVDLLNKYKINPKVVDCVAEHHEDRPFSHIESAIVNLADHISGARPAARSEDYEAYVKRLKDLESAALSFDGVEKAFAVSAGREVRVFVSPEKVDDFSTAYLAREIAKKIELEQTYPGVVKVIVIRETRVIETAK
jgi:ribonuclease Y